LSTDSKSGRLEGKIVVMTGVGRGMAREVAARFAAEGAKIVACDIDEEGAAEAVEVVRAAGGEIDSLYPLDLTVESEAKRLADFAMERHGRIDVLYNNAMSASVGVFDDISLEEWRTTIDRTLTPAFLTTKAVVPYMREGGGGSIVFVGSITGMPVGAGFPSNFGILFAYGVAKAGILRMANSLANELAPDGIRVNSLAPGPVLTPVAAELYGEKGSEPRRIIETGSLVGRLGEPIDIANAALFLASDESSWITGHNLVADGGFVASGGVGPTKDADRAVMEPLLRQVQAGLPEAAR
jgi:NAD(P)-dependent dehydrogenase (short-subunit alcohol dehydrogenase family)